MGIARESTVIDVHFDQAASSSGKISIAGSAFGVIHWPQAMDGTQVAVNCHDSGLPTSFIDPDTGQQLVIPINLGQTHRLPDALFACREIELVSDLPQNSGEVNLHITGKG